MSKTVRLSERDLTRLIKRVINEDLTDTEPTNMGSSKTGCQKPTNGPCSQFRLKNLDGMIISFGGGMTKFIATNPQNGCPESCIVDTKNGKDVFRYVRTKN
jgi:hypothetical protein